MKTENKMGTHGVFGLLVAMSVPPTISMMINSLYNIIDSIFVARLGTEALTAVSLAFPIQNIILALASGIGIGVNSYIARKLGEKDFKTANKTAGLGLTLSVVHFIGLVLLGMIFIKPFFRIFTDNAEILDMSYSYTYIVTYLSIGTIMQTAIEKILQGTGNTLAPMYLQIIGAITNIILDPILIYGYFGMPAMGVKGAAIATVIGQFAALAASIYVLFFRKQEVTISTPDLKWDNTIVKEIYNVGVPSFFIMSIGSFLVMGINFILAGISDIAVSLFGIYFKLQTFIYMPTTGLTQGAMPIMGYNYGARNRKRVCDTLNYAMILCVIINTLGTILFWIFPSQILGFFSATPEMIKMGITTMKIISLSYSFGSVCFIISSFLQAIGKGTPSLVITLLRQLILLLPLAFILGKYFSLVGVWASFPIVDVTTCVLATLIYKNFARKDPVISRA